MPYVMVPVPEEHEDDVLQFVMGLRVKAAMTRWPDGALEQFVAGLDERERELVEAVLGPALQGRAARSPDLSEALSMDTDAVAELVQHLAKRCWDAGWPALVLAGVQDEAAAGGATQQVPTFIISPEVAPRVREVMDEAAS